MYFRERLVLVIPTKQLYYQGELDQIYQQEMVGNNFKWEGGNTT